MLWIETRKSLQLEAVIWHPFLHNSNLLMIENWLIAIHAKNSFWLFKNNTFTVLAIQSLWKPLLQKIAKYAFTW